MKLAFISELLYCNSVCCVIRDGNDSHQPETPIISVMSSVVKLVVHTLQVLVLNLYHEVKKKSDILFLSITLY